MRFLCILFIALLLCGCSGSQAVFSEHPEEAAMQSAAEFDIHLVQGENGAAIQSCRLPLERHMEQSLAERFLEENRNVLPEPAAIQVMLDADLATIDILNLPLPESAAMDALLGALTDTMLQLPQIRRLRLLFDGEELS